MHRPAHDPSVRPSYAPRWPGAAPASAVGHPRPSCEPPGHIRPPPRHRASADVGGGGRGGARAPEETPVVAAMGVLSSHLARTKSIISVQRRQETAPANNYACQRLTLN